MFFVRKAAEPIGGATARRSREALPSMRRALLDAPVIDTAEHPFWTRLLPAQQAPLLNAPVTGTTSALPKPISVVAARRQHAS